MGENNYNPWYMCSNIYNEYQPQYIQRNNQGFKCCNKPNIQDIIYGLDSGYNDSISNYIQLPTDNIDTSIGKYISLYENVVKSCIYFKISNTGKGFIPLNYNDGNNYLGLSNYLKTNYSELYNYTLKSSKLLYVLFQQKTTTDIYYLKFFDNNSECYQYNIASKISTSVSNYMPAYFIYTDTEDINLYVFIPICVNNATSNNLSSFNIPGIDFQINSITNSNGKICSTSSCTSNDYYSFAGQNISNHILYKSNNNNLPQWYESYYFIGLLIGITFIIIIIVLLNYITPLEI